MEPQYRTWYKDVSGFESQQNQEMITKISKPGVTQLPIQWELRCFLGGKATEA